ncbi:MAG: hypothetical protein V7707_11220 [Motiliproteus sp.]
MVDIWALVRELEKDIDVIGGLCIADQGNIALRRAYVKAVFSALDGTLYDLRQDIISSQNLDKLFTTREKGRLLEKSVQKGVVTKFTQYLALRDSIPFTMKCYAKHIGLNGFNFPSNSDGWEKLKLSIDLRHRITHPKTVQDLHVSINDFENLVAAKVWFKDEISQQFVV